MAKKKHTHTHTHTHRTNVLLRMDIFQQQKLLCFVSRWTFVDNEERINGWISNGICVCKTIFRYMRMNAKYICFTVNCFFWFCFGVRWVCLYYFDSFLLLLLLLHKQRQSEQFNCLFLAKHVLVLQFIDRHAHGASHTFKRLTSNCLEINSYFSISLSLLAL